MYKINIALVEDQRLFRDGLHALLKETEDFEVLTVADNGREFLNQLEGMKVHPDVVLLDMNMPEMNGFELTEVLLKQYPSMRIIILTVHNQERFIVKMIESGVAGYLVKNCDIEEVRAAVRASYKTGFYFNESTMLAMRNGYRTKNNQVRSFANIPVELTEREIEVLRLICKELTNAEIAEQLSISPRTVDGHRNNLLSKVGCKNTAGLVLFAVNNNYYDQMSF
jgi:DNA-binding NarL/FixJ family response regulator